MISQIQNKRLQETTNQVYFLFQYIVHLNLLEIGTKQKTSINYEPGLFYFLNLTRSEAIVAVADNTIGTI